MHCGKGPNTQQPISNKRFGGPVMRYATRIHFQQDGTPRSGNDPQLLEPARSRSAQLPREDAARLRGSCSDRLFALPGPHPERIRAANAVFLRYAGVRPLLASRHAHVESKQLLKRSPISTQLPRTMPARTQARRRSSEASNSNATPRSLTSSHAVRSDRAPLALSGIVKERRVASSRGANGGKGNAS